MSTRISEHPECALYEIRKATLLTALAFAGKRIDRKPRRWAAQGSIHQFSSVIGQPGSGAQLVGYALTCFQHRMKVVVRHQLCAAEAQHIGVNAASYQVSP